MTYADGLDVIPNFEEAKEAIQNVKGEEQVDDTMIYTSVLVSFVFEANIFHRKILGNLTGLDLDTDEQLYSYLVRAIDLDKDTAADYTLAFMATQISLEDLKKMKGKLM